MQQPIDERQDYDPVATEYARRFLHELDYKPWDCALLDRFAALVAGKSRVMDIGTGPGQVAAYLHSRGLDVFGVDLSAAMVAQAQAANPQVEFRQGDMRSLDLPDNSLAGITALYSIIHIDRTGVTTVLKELRRVLQPGGRLLLSFHEGDEIRHFDELWGQQVKLDFVFFMRAEMEGYLREAGFAIDDVLERDAIPEQEVATHRIYIIASKPSDGIS
ncbi:MAG TPA: class I SAM-dependent methyltransferase [Chloroflexia bacterium]|nr:class I SAM-dependent methyltransferase [Chloroflexia bacterium]